MNTLMTKRVWMNCSTRNTLFLIPNISEYIIFESLNLKSNEVV